ncbi:hypothetical protein ACFQX6_19185 [Streptosporangium lutulentum]
MRGALNMTYIGSRVPRREDHDLLTGRAVTVADLSEPGTVEVAFVRSPVAHGRLLGVDTFAACESPGFVGAWSAADLPDLRPCPPCRTGRDGRRRWTGPPSPEASCATRASRSRWWRRGGGRRPRTARNGSASR